MGVWQRLDKTVVASVALHLAVLGWGLISFQTKAFTSMEESLPVDVISADQLAKVMAGHKSGKKDNPKPLVEKIAEAKPVDDTVGKISEKPPVVTEVKPPPAPEPPKVEKKPDPKPEPKPVAETKPEPPKPVEKKPEPPKVDPIAEALKKEEKKEPPKPQQAKAAQSAPKQPPIKERHFDQSKIAELLDKREASRAAVTGEALNSNAALGTARGRAADNSATWGSMFRSQVERCWKKPFGGIEARTTQAIFSIKLKRDGTLEATPTAVSSPTTPFFRVYQESAMRAIIECQPYNLPAAFFDEWKFFEPVFTENQTG